MWWMWLRCFRWGHARCLTSSWCFWSCFQSVSDFLPLLGDLTLVALALRYVTLCCGFGCEHFLNDRRAVNTALWGPQHTGFDEAVWWYEIPVSFSGNAKKSLSVSISKFWPALCTVRTVWPLPPAPADPPSLFCPNTRLQQRFLLKSCLLQPQGKEDTCCPYRFC